MKNCGYIPRHIRLGTANVAPISFDVVHEVQERVPILDENGNVVSFQVTHRSVPASEVLGRFEVSEFDLGTQIENGVDLKAININRSHARSIQEIEQIVSKLGSLEAYAKKVDAQNAEFDSLYKPLNEEENG